MTPGTVFLITSIAILVFVTGLLVWDWRLYNDKVERNSITQSVIDFSKKCQLIPWAIGFFMGFIVAHFWA